MKNNDEPLRPAITTWLLSLLRAKAFAGPSWVMHTVLDVILRSSK